MAKGFVLKILFGLIAVLIGVCLYGVPGVPDVDSYSYQRMAEGRMADVVRPYANRVLHPMIVRWTGGSFEAVAGMTLLVTLAALAGLITLDGCRAGRDRRETLSEAGFFACLVCVPFLCSYLVEIYLCDLFVMALTVLFFWFLHKARLGWALVLLFLMQVARESTIVVAAAFGLVSLLRRRWWTAAGVVGAVAGAMAAVAFLSRESLNNIHDMGSLVYMGTKVFANGLANRKKVVSCCKSTAIHDKNPNIFAIHGVL